jgi:hypothetical protein
MLQSNISFRLRNYISQTATTGGTFEITNDAELNQPINTDGNIVSLVFYNSRERERFTVTITDNICTIVKRGITQIGGVEAS